LELLKGFRIILKRKKPQFEEKERVTVEQLVDIVLSNKRQNYTQSARPKIRHPVNVSRWSW